MSQISVPSNSRVNTKQRSRSKSMEVDVILNIYQTCVTLEDTSFQHNKFLLMEAL